MSRESNFRCMIRGIPFPTLNLRDARGRFGNYGYSAFRWGNGEIVGAPAIEVLWITPERIMDINSFFLFS